MTKLKTPEEMNTLIEKLNKGEITWDHIPEKLERIRRQQVKPIIQKSSIVLINKYKKAAHMKFDRTKVNTNEISNKEAKEISDELENICEQSNNWFKVAMFGKRNGKYD